jgi:3-hydroxybutyrate dehydrogenase/3-oxoacyl-[acyl-carrier protein] reductase
MGRGIAEAFLAEGALVVISGRSAESGAKALAEIGAGDRAIAVPCDARDQAQVEALVDATTAHFGRLDVLVNSAGGSDGFAPVHQLSDAAWTNAMDFILNSAFWATRRALNHMVGQGSGRIINISSIEGKLGNKANISHYVTAKHAMNGFTKAVAFEYGRQGITCNAICPGAVETAAFAENGRAYAEGSGMSYDDFVAMYANESAIGRLNTVAEVAALAVLLAGPTGGGINGALLNVDGGTAPY